MRNFFTLLLMCSVAMVFAQDKELDPIKWSFDSNQVGPDNFEMIFRADFKSPWVVYSMFTPDDGPIPTSVDFTSKNVELESKAKEKGERVEAMDKMFETKVIKFKADQPYVIKQTVKITDLRKPVKGFLTYMACNNEYCLPPKEVPFKFSYSVNDIKTVDPGSTIKLKTPKKSF